MDALVIGGSGFVGRRLSAMLGPTRSIATFRSHPLPGGVRFDATDERLSDLLARLERRPTHVLVLHGAIDMEGCARDPAGTAKVNIESGIRVLEDALNADLTPVYISTDYVFDGTRALWHETDVAVPRMAYGAQKLAVEQWLTGTGAPHLIVRFSKVVSGDTQTHSQLGQWVNEIRAGATMRCADDQFYTPVFLDDVAGVLIRLVEGGASGLYHLGGPERFSRINLLRLLAAKIRAVEPAVNPTIVPCSLHDLPFLEKRPLDTSLSIDKLQAALDWRFRPMDQLCAEIAAAHFG
jgi:dTDP-4-dehydrorhamnose reductase